MKSVTFILNRLIMGGTETAFLRLIEHIDREKFEINLILMRHGGELESSLPDYVKVGYRNTRSLAVSLKHFDFADFFAGIYYRIRIRRAKNSLEEAIYTYKVMTFPESVDADYVICYYANWPLCALIAANSKAQRKIFWVHTELNEGFRGQAYNELMNKFDCVCCVSDSMKRAFDHRFPLLADKSTVIYNLVDEDKIRRKAEEETGETLEPVSLMTVGRLSEEKGQLMIPAVVRRLLDHGYTVNWYLIGGGPLEAEVRDEIKRNAVEGHVHLLGVKKNPYPYMNMCDLYVQPSVYEGFGLTVQEAKILCKPIIATDIPAFREQITNGENGILTEGKPESMFRAIAGLIDDKTLRERFTENLSGCHFDIQNEMDKLYKYVLV